MFIYHNLICRCIFLNVLEIKWKTYVKVPFKHKQNASNNSNGTGYKLLWAHAIGTKFEVLCNSFIYYVIVG